MNRIIGFPAVLLFLVCCSKSRYDGYSNFKEHLDYRMIAVGDESKSYCDQCYLTMSLKISDTDGKPIATKQYNLISFKDITKTGLYGEFLSTCAEGDSFECIGLPKILGIDKLTDENLFRNASTPVKITTNVLNIISDSDLREIRAHERMKQDLELKEQARLNVILDSLRLTEENKIDGMFYQSLLEGIGKKPKPGSYLTVQYTGKFGNGTEFENTFKGQPLLYQYGKPDQVLPGFARGISKMKEGGEALFIIPSQLAFGETGSSSGIVPPFTTLIYRVKLVKVEG